MSEKTIARIEDNQLNKETAFGWQKYSREPVDVYRVPGDHYSLLQMPNVDVIIKRLKAI